MTRRTIVRSLAVAAGAVAATAALAIPAQGATNDFIQGNLLPLQNLTTNPCGQTITRAGQVGQDFGTNFDPAPPGDPNGFGFANQTAVGWTGNIYPPFEYLSGSYFARGVPVLASNGACGAMYSFGAYTWGLPLRSNGRPQAPPPQSETWNMVDGYLPAMVTSFTRNDVHISITDFADKQTIAGGPVELVYTHITVTNNSNASVDVPPGGSGPNLVELDNASSTVDPGQTVTHDFVAAVDTFSVGGTLPTVDQITAQASSEPAAFTHMKNFWNNLLSTAPQLSLPNVALPHTNNLQNPGTAMTNAFKAAEVYTHIVQAGNSPFSGANQYAWLLNHDLPGIMQNRFLMGDLQDAQNMLLIGRISEETAPTASGNLRLSFNEFGANIYWDGVWRTPLAWAQYLQETGNVAFVKAHFMDDANGAATQLGGPSLFTMMHTDLLSQIDPNTGYLKESGDNDSGGTWVFDDLTALAGLQAYSYIAQRIGNTEEAQWAQNEYTSLLNATNAGLQQNEAASGANALPCEVNVAIETDRCNTHNDANWASQLLWGENQWSTMLEGGQLNGILGSATQADNMYREGFARLNGDGNGVPFPSFGAYSGYSVALNTAYSADGLYGNEFRDLPITSYAWQIAATTGGPNSWWEAQGSPPNPNNPWIGDHTPPEFGATPYVWTMAGQTQTVMQALVAQGMTNTVSADGTPDFQPVVYIGRGVPNAWITPGQTIAVNNITSDLNETTGQRQTYGVSISTANEGGTTAVHVSLSGQTPGSDYRVQLPIFADDGVQSVSGGSYDASTQTVTMNGNSTIIRLGQAAKPTVSVSVDSTHASTNNQPNLMAEQPATGTATFTNNGATTLTNVKLTPSVATDASDWSFTATSPSTFASVAPGQTVTETFGFTTPNQNPGVNVKSGGNGITFTATYNNGFSNGTAEGEQWVDLTLIPIPPPPIQGLLPGQANLSLTATPVVSTFSPWSDPTAFNNGIQPITSEDDACTVGTSLPGQCTVYWGTWPNAGTQFMELDWNSPITTNSTWVWFANDLVNNQGQGCIFGTAGCVNGGGLQVPDSWVVQWWDASTQTWQDVTNVQPVAGGSGPPNNPNYPEALDTFNKVSFDPVTTTKLRVTMVTSNNPPAGGVGAVQWVVPSIVSGG